MIAGDTRADGTISLVQTQTATILVDTGGPGNKQFLTDGKASN